jgi:gluconolactonase
MVIQLNSKNPLKGWSVNRADIQYIGKDLQGPECILTEPDGTIWTDDARGGVMEIKPNGSQLLILPKFEASAKTTTVGNFENRYVKAQGSLQTVFVSINMAVLSSPIGVLITLK